MWVHHCRVRDTCSASAVAIKEKRRKHKPVVMPDQHDDEEGGSDSDGDQFAEAQVCHVSPIEHVRSCDQPPAYPYWL